MIFNHILIVLGLIQSPTTTSASQQPMPNMQAEVCGQIPKGTGLGDNGAGWIHIMKTGYYSFPNAQLLNRDKGKQLLKANQTYYILPHKEMESKNKSLDWIDTEGHKGIVPINQLFPPYEQVKK